MGIRKGMKRKGKTWERGVKREGRREDRFERGRKGKGKEMKKIASVEGCEKKKGDAEERETWKIGGRRRLERG